MKIVSALALVFLLVALIGSAYAVDDSPRLSISKEDLHSALDDVVKGLDVVQKVINEANTLIK
ncbi:hypothetical protein TYRP_015402 [Tyrophagus putrescentiae]|nr:hypothetical protein TYRP_015402 [Tyrophagus putrescentiae]